MWYRAKGWGVWVAMGFSAVIVSLVLLQRWWALVFQVAWLGGYLLWRRSRQLPPLPDDRPSAAPSRSPSPGVPDGSGWTFERNHDGSHTWTNADGRRVVMD